MRKTLSLFFDLDGTLIDSSERMFRLFNKLIPESTLTKKKYWNLKRSKVSHQMLLERYFPQYDFEIFNRKWLSMIELEEYLNMDVNYPDTISVLEKLSLGNNVFLLTARQNKANLLAELNRLKIRKYFDKILVTEAKISKQELIINAVKSGELAASNNCLFIGDTGNDILCGKVLGAKTVAITHGFMNREKLSDYKSSYVIDELLELIPIVKRTHRGQDNFLINYNN